jgi:transposase
MVSTMLSSGHRPAGPDGAGVERVLRNGKRVYLPDFKLGLVRRCLQPGVSVAAVALEHRVNANLLRKWIDKHRGEVGAQTASVLVPVTIEAPKATLPVTTTAGAPASSLESCGAIHIEAFGARVTLHGEIDARRLQLVLDALARCR